MSRELYVVADESPVPQEPRRFTADEEAGLTMIEARGGSSRQTKAQAPAVEWTRLDVRDALAAEPKPTDWLYRGVLAVGESGVVTAPPGLAKTYILMGLTVHGAIGRPGLGVYEVPHPLKCLWIDEEMGATMLSDRLTRMVLGDDLTPEEIELLAANLDIRPQQGIDLSDPEQFAVYDRTLREGQYDVVVMDSMIALTTGEENSANDTRKFYNRCIAPYKGPLGTAFLLAAHPPKPHREAAPDAGKHPRGSGDKLAMVDRSFWLEKQGEEITADSHVLKVILNRGKQRAGGSVDGHLIVVDGPPEKPVTVRSMGATGSAAAVQDIGKLNACQHEILARLRSAPDLTLYQADLIRHLESLGFDRRRHYYPALNALLSQKFVRTLKTPGKSGKSIQLVDLCDD